MERAGSGWRRSAARLVAAVLTAAAAIYALHLLLVGVRGVKVMAVAPGEPLGPGIVEYRPFPLAVIPLAAAAVVAAGLWPRGRRALAWLGVTALLLFAGLTVFSVGLILLPIAGLLLVALFVLTAWLAKRGALRSPARVQNRA